MVKKQEKLLNKKRYKAHYGIFLMFCILLVAGIIPFVSSYDGELINSWSLTAGHDNPTGMSSNGTHLFMGDFSDNDVRVYLNNGTYVSAISIAGSGYIRGVEVVEPYLWVTRENPAEVHTLYKYWTNGTYIEHYSIDEGVMGNVDIKDLAYYNNSFYSVSVDNASVVKLNLTGTLVDNWTILI